MLGREEVRRALAEDRASEDVTTRLLGTAAAGPAIARFVAAARAGRHRRGATTGPLADRSDDVRLLKVGVQECE